MRHLIYLPPKMGKSKFLIYLHARIQLKLLKTRTKQVVTKETKGQKLKHLIGFKKNNQLQTKM